MTSPTFGGWRGSDRLIELLHIEERENPKILEVGCSTGYITRHVSQQFECEIIGVDLSQLLIDIASEKADELNLQNISFQVANVEKLPFPDNSFDIVYGEAITALVPDPIMVINEYKRILKPGGELATLDLFMNTSISTKFVEETNEIMSNVIGSRVKIRTFQEWERIFNESGFTNSNLLDFYDDIFKRTYSFGKQMKILFKMLYHMIVNKEIRHKLTPTLKFARKFQKLLKGNNFGYIIFFGIK
jgi:ubiquinone/menaquinone biosynthesis C-methylase UbiE